MIYRKKDWGVWTHWETHVGDCEDNLSRWVYLDTTWFPASLSMENPGDLLKVEPTALRGGRGPPGVVCYATPPVANDGLWNFAPEPPIPMPGKGGPRGPDGRLLHSQNASGMGVVLESNSGLENVASSSSSLVGAPARTHAHVMVISVVPANPENSYTDVHWLHAIHTHDPPIPPNPQPANAAQPPPVPIPPNPPVGANPPMAPPINIPLLDPPSSLTMFRWVYSPYQLWFKIHPQ